MKKATITVNFDDEKTSALKLYLGQKKTTVEEELVKSLETLYTKSVPAGVRDFIALRSGEVTEQSVAKPKKAKPPKDNLTDNHQKPENNDFRK